MKRGKAPKCQKLCRIASRFFLVATAICGVTLGSVLTAAADGSFHPPVVFTESGILIGSKTQGMHGFLGIPYAAPPVGASRWTPPQAYQNLPSPFQAIQFGSVCTQLDEFGQPVGSENCLFLNVYTPESESLPQSGKLPRGLPVMVWIHGGGFLDGSSNAYDPTRLVKKGVIVVTINYRLGFFGLFAHPAIDDE